MTVDRTSMRFSLPAGRGALRPDAPVRTLDLVAEAERLGYESLWFGERTLGAVPLQGKATSLIVTAAAVAAVTTRVRLGLAVLLPAAHDVHRLGEQLAALDLLSGGRVELGVGWPAATAGASAGPGSSRSTLADQLDRLLEWWSARDGETCRGGGTPAAPVRIAPRDDQDIAWAAARGYGLILPACQPLTALAGDIGRFRAAGGDPAEIWLERFCLLAPTDGAAMSRARAPITALVGQRAQQPPEGIRQRVEREDLDPERFLAHTALVGGPETVTRRLVELRHELGVTSISVRPSLGGNATPEVQRETVALFATEVMPTLAASPR